MPNRPSLHSALEEFDYKFISVGKTTAGELGHYATPDRLRAFLTKAITEALESVVPEERKPENAEQEQWCGGWHYCRSEAIRLKDQYLEGEEGKK